MKRYVIGATLLASIVALTNCNSSKKATASKPAPVTYSSQVQALVVEYCSPCHIPSKGGNKKSYDNFANVSHDIDEIIRRVELDPSTRGFMPFKRPKLSDSTIAVLKQWKTDGLKEN